MKRMNVYFIVLMVFCLAAQLVAVEPVKVTIEDKVLFDIDDRIFGHFLEKPSWGGEFGPESAVIPGTHNLDPRAVQLLKDLQMPIVRFPGGTDVDYLNWCDMIDHVPGRKWERPMSMGRQGQFIPNQFGYDEFLRLCPELGTEPILVVNFRDGFMKVKPIKEAATHAAALVAYCNSPVENNLPDALTFWPRIRRMNGHADPYKVKYFQIGNETWLFNRRPDYKEMIEKNNIQDVDNYYVDCLKEYVDAMRAVDPSIVLIVDVLTENMVRIMREKIGDDVDYIVRHTYMPWGIREVLKDTISYSPNQLTDEMVWNTWVAIPNTRDEQGNSIYKDVVLKAGKKYNYLVAVTEWNWNGWWQLADEYKDLIKATEDPDATLLHSRFAQGVGAAGYLHAFMRSGDQVKIGCQSMTLGGSWDITGIRIDTTGKQPPRLYPTGHTTMFYAKHHGSQCLNHLVENLPTYEQPFRMSGIRPQQKVATLDIIITENEKKIFVHVINRSFDKNYPIHIDLSAFDKLSGKAELHSLEGHLRNFPPEGEDYSYEKMKKLKFKKDVLKTKVPKRSVSCIEIMK